MGTKFTLIPWEQGHHSIDHMFYNFQGIQAHTNVTATCGR